MRIAILTSQRFHVLDLARELARLGHEVRFYSLLTGGRTAQFGLPPECNVCLLPWVLPLVAAQKIAPHTLKHASDNLLRRALDTIAAMRIEPCDLLIGMSGLTVKAAAAVKRKYGAKVYLERGSRHILSQKEILDAIPDLPESSKVSAVDVEREEAGYALADMIVVGSRHCEASFTERGFAPNRLFRNPYGVDLSMFAPTKAPPPEPQTILMTGSWSLQKGCDTLTQAWQRLQGVKLIHVGPVDDAPLPVGPDFEHHDKVDQSTLRDFYARAHVFALPSRQDGFGMVLAQALSSGLPVVCSSRTGGPDLAEMLDDHNWVTVVPPENPEALVKGLQIALDRAKIQQGLRDILGGNATKLSWQAYGERYHHELLARFKN